MTEHGVVVLLLFRHRRPSPLLTATMGYYCYCCDEAMALTWTAAVVAMCEHYYRYYLICWEKRRLPCRENNRCYFCH
jgi:hypothetical protein